MYQPKHEEVLEILHGAYDLHTHTAPDFYPRSLDDEELLRQTDEYCMAGVMLKNHLDPTPARAALINASGRYHAKAYGGMVTNISVGGLNPVAVHCALELGAKVVWMPTVHARNQIEYTRLDKFADKYAGIRLLDEDGALKTEVYEILELIREYGAAVATGHISIGESIAVCSAAREMGIKTILTHPDWTCTTVPIEIQKRLADKGVIVEKLWFDIGLNHITAEYMAKTIWDLGAQNCYLATDRGQKGFEYPVEGLMMFMDAMFDNGLSAREIEIMTHETPERVIG